jgi:uncharacterized membrane protein YgdD (TMEM256/DUF423 family)
MVTVVLALLPVLVGGVTHTVQWLLPHDVGSELSLSVTVHMVLVLAAVVAAILAARRRRAGLPRWAWIALLAGIVLFSSGELWELVTRLGDSWVEETVRIAAFVPFAAFAWQVASPLTIVYWSRRRLAAMVLVAAALFAGIAAFELVPILAGAAPGDLKSGALRALTLVRPFLDALLFLPLIVSLAFAGLRRRGEPYLFVGLGLLCELAGDILFHYDLMTEAPGLEEVAFLFTAASLAYFVIGSLWCALRREHVPAEGVSP